MGETSFRATFEADDKSFSSTMRKMRTEAHTMAQEMITDANAVAGATQQNVNKVLQEQIALYEKRRDITKREERMALDSQYQAKISSATPDNRAGLHAQWEGAKGNLEKQFKNDDLQVDLLREIISTLKETAAEQIISDKDTVKENIGRIKDGSASGMSPEDEYKARVQSSLIKDNEKIEKEKSRTWETAIGTFLGNQASQMLHKIGGIAEGAVSASDGDVVASKLWSIIPVAGDALSAASARHLELAEKSDRLSMSLRAKGMNIGLSGDSDKLDYDLFLGTAGSKSAASDISKSIPELDINGDLKSENAKFAASTDDQRRREIERTRFIAEHDQKAIQRDNVSWSYRAAGVDEVEFKDMSMKLLSANPMIKSASDLHKQTMSLIDITQGGGIGDGTALGLAGLQKLGGGGSDIRDVMGQLVGNLGSGTTRAMRDSNVADVISMVQSRASSGFNINPEADTAKMANIKAAFQSNYGVSLSSSDNIMSMMAAMANPQDDNQQAMNYKIYASQMSKAGLPVSYVGFKKWQEKPENGLMFGKMDLIKETFGSTDYGVMAMNALGGGKTWEASELYVKKGASGLSPDELNKNQEKVKFNAADYATDRQVQQAALTDAFIKSMTEGIATAFSQVGNSIAEKIATSNLPWAGDLAQKLVEWSEKNKKNKN